jgi:hypothetical protein
MRVLLQHKETGLYFKDVDSWARTSTEAMEFVNSTAALEFSAANHLDRLQVVLKFDEQHYDIVLPALVAPEASTEAAPQPRA